MGSARGAVNATRDSVQRRSSRRVAFCPRARIRLRWPLNEPVFSADLARAEMTDHRHKIFRLQSQIIPGGGRLLHHRNVLLSHALHLVDTGAHRLQGYRLLLGGVGDFRRDAIGFADLRNRLALRLAPSRRRFRERSARRAPCRLIRRDQARAYRED